MTDTRTNSWTDGRTGVSDVTDTRVGEPRTDGALRWLGAKTYRCEVGFVGFGTSTYLYGEAWDIVVGSCQSAPRIYAKRC